MSAGEDFGFAIDMTVRNEWKNVDLLRTSVQNCFTAVFADVDGCHAIAMVTGELLENALKYGDWASNRRAKFRLRVTGDTSRISVSVQNPLAPGADDAPRLMETIAWINSFPSPADAYRERMLQIAQEDGGEEHPSRLGLARVASEGNCKISATTSDGTVTVHALLEL